MTNPNEFNQEKTGVGVLLSLFLSLLGLIIGLLLYPAGTVSRKSFLRGWTITFAILAGISVVLIILFFGIKIDVVLNPTNYK